MDVKGLCFMLVTINKTRKSRDDARNEKSTFRPTKPGVNIALLFRADDRMPFICLAGCKMYTSGKRHFSYPWRGTDDANNKS